MLTASFACFRGLSAAAERKLWEAGCLDWRMFQNLPPNLLSPRKADAVKEEIRRARNALQAGMPDFFLNRFERENDPQALQHLTLYNAEDVVMLEKLACLAYKRSMQAFPVKTDIHPGCPSDWTLENRTSAL